MSLPMNLRLLRSLRRLMPLTLATLAGVVPALQAQVPVYRTGKWTADSFGNHRAVVSVQAASPAVWAHLPWRRPDQHPEKKDVWVVDAKTGQRVMNVSAGRSRGSRGTSRSSR